MAEPALEAAVRAPAAPLRAFVDRYIGYRQEGVPPYLHRGLPSGHLTLIISLAGPLVVAGPGSLTPPFPEVGPPSRGWLESSATVAGLHAAPAVIRHDGHQFGVQIELTPLGARALLGLPAAELATTVVGLGDVLGPRAAELRERLAEAGDWPGRFTVLDRLLGRLAANGTYREGPPAVARAWQRLVEARGAVRVRDLAAEVGWTRRHLATSFQDELGLSPKLAARVLRFERAVRLLRGDGGRGLADVAGAAGYFDQAHLTRDWKEFAGCTPSTWVSEELRYLTPLAAD
jgi:AraC-like DNA-binding protein